MFYHADSLRQEALVSDKSLTVPAMQTQRWRLSEIEQNKVRTLATLCERQCWLAIPAQV